MKIAVPYENGQVFQNFGHSAQFKIQDTETGKILSSEIVSTNAANATFRNQIDIWKLMLFHMQRAGHFCGRPVQWSHTRPALQILHGPRSSASHRSFSTCPAVHLLILSARRRLPGTSSHPPELLRRRLLQFLFAERHRTLLFLFQDGSSDGVHLRNLHAAGAKRSPETSRRWLHHQGIPGQAGTQHHFPHPEKYQNGIFLPHHLHDLCLERGTEEMAGTDGSRREERLDTLP